MSRAVAIGEKHEVLGFKGAGFEIIPVSNAQVLSRELGELSREHDVALVLVTEELAIEAESAINEFRERSSALLTVIPNHAGSRHTSFEAMRKAVERSMGVDILGARNED